MTRKQELINALKLAATEILAGAALVEAHADDDLASNDWAEFEEVNRNDIGRLDMILSRATEQLGEAEDILTSGMREWGGRDIDAYKIGAIVDGWPEDEAA